MNRTNPPRVATWLIHHLSSSGCDEALAGDLLEEYRAGRSVSWYWRQTIAAIAASWTRRLWRLWAALLFAVVWSFFFPAWMLLRFRYGRHSPIFNAFWSIPWPWSTICEILLNLAFEMLFIWLGVFVYALLCRIAFGKLQFRRYWMAILASIVAWAISSFGLLAGAIYVSDHLNRRPDVAQPFTLIGIVGDLNIWMLLVRIPFFAGTAAAFWYLSPRTKNAAKPVA